MWICTKKLFIIGIVLFLVVILLMITQITSVHVTIANVEANVKQTRGQTPAKSHARRNKNKSEEILLLSATNGVKVFVLFIGHTHSSHSIVASVLDSHPHMIVSHESGIIPALINTPSAVTKSDVYNRIWTSSCKSVHGKRASSGKGYNLMVDKEWQGRYDNYVNVFGDDEAQVIPTRLYYAREKVLAMFKRLPTLVGVPIKLFHVIRNPYDNIATDVLYRTFRHDHRQVSDAKSINKSVTVNPEVVDASIRYYFRLYEGVEYVKKVYKFDIMTIHIKEFIFDPKSAITKMCEFLGVVCSEEYIRKCSERIFNKESRTRYKITWKNEQIANIYSSIQMFDSLKRYEKFDS